MIQGDIAYIGIPRGVSIDLLDMGTGQSVEICRGDVCLILEKNERHCTVMIDGRTYRCHTLWLRSEAPETEDADY